MAFLLLHNYTDFIKNSVTNTIFILTDTKELYFFIHITLQINIIGEKLNCN